jgi:hypothetical protein
MKKRTKIISLIAAIFSVLEMFLIICVVTYYVSNLLLRALCIIIAMVSSIFATQTSKLAFEKDN